MRPSTWLALGLALSACAAGSPPALLPRTPAQQLQRVLENGLDDAKQRIEAKDGFLPFALVLHPDGSLDKLGGRSGYELDTATDSTLTPDPARLLAGLQERVAREAKASPSAFLAVGFFSETEVRLGDGETSDAIRAALEQQSGECSEVFVPYSEGDDGFDYAEPIHAQRKGVVFGCR